MIPTLTAESKPSFIAAADRIRMPVRGEDPAVLAEIFGEAVNIAIWQRSVSNELGDAASDIVAGKRALNISMTVAWHDALDRLTDALGTDRRCLLSRDIAELTEMFCFLLGIQRVGLRLAVLNGPMCPKFHVDRVPCRLIATYQGAGTEWLAHEAVNRSKLGLGSDGRPDHESGLYTSADAIEQLNCGDVALMKGELWENNEGAGLVHRSPAVTDGVARLLLSLDVSA